ncbi:MAG: FAD-binding protein [Acidimicrobiales bacterium]
MVTPRTEDEIATVLSPQAGDGGRGVIARGLGRSYGDAAQSSGGVVLDTAGFADIGAVDPTTGLVTVGGGASLDQLIRSSLPGGWFVPVTPGTRQVTVGGAIAADVHGKNHHLDGSFCRHVAALTLVTPAGAWETSPDTEPELFWATAGGMGLTGVVTRATLRMRPVETSFMTVDTVRYPDLDSVMAEMEHTDSAHRYSVAWVDCMGREKRLGRAILTRGDHAPASALNARHRSALVRPPGNSRLRVPVPAPRGVLNTATMAAFNEVWFRKAPRRRIGAVKPLGPYFHPLDGVTDWNLLYGRAGFVQYQFAVPDSRGDTVRQAVGAISTSGVPSFLAVLKRFGPRDPGPLSFPIAGWTLALDFPIGPPGLRPLLDGLDEQVADAGGRVYLAKDSRLRPDLVKEMYPEIGALTAVRRRVDPQGVLRSDLSTRLGLDRDWAT